MSLPAHDLAEEAPPAALRAFLGVRKIEGRVLVPGCGAGETVRLLSAQGARVVGLDRDEAAIAFARSRPAVGAEEYLNGDWLTLPMRLAAGFDWVVDHSCFAPLSPTGRGRYADSVEFCLRAGGRLFAVFHTGPVADPEHREGITKAELDRSFARFDLLGSWRDVASVDGEPRPGPEVRLYRKRL